MLKVNENVKEFCSSGQGKSGVNRIIPRSEITIKKKHPLRGAFSFGQTE
jgi:hypothetical protein